MECFHLNKRFDENGHNINKIASQKMSTSNPYSDDSEKDVGYTTHEAPVLSQTYIDAVPVYTVPSESGYFPTGHVNHELVYRDNNNN